MLRIKQRSHGIGAWTIDLNEDSSIVGKIHLLARALGL